jgi:hypothetical protein
MERKQVTGIKLLGAFEQYWTPLLGYQTQAVFTHILWRANPRRSGWCFESVSRMARFLVMGRNELQRELNVLVALGLVLYEAKLGMTTKYRPASPLPLPVRNQALSNARSVKKDLSRIGARMKRECPAPVYGPIADQCNGPVRINATNTENNTDREKVETSFPQKNVPGKKSNGNRDKPVNAPDLVAYFATAYEDAFSEPYEPSWKKDTGIFKLLLKNRTPEQLTTKIDNLFRWFWKNNWRSRNGGRPTIEAFRSCFNEMPTKQPKQARGPKQEYDTWN